MATQKSEQDTNLTDVLCQEFSRLKRAATESEPQKTLVEDLQRKVKLLENAAVKAQHTKHEEERRIQLSERSDLLETYSKLLDLKKAVLNAEDKAALREKAWIYSLFWVN